MNWAGRRVALLALALACGAGLGRAGPAVAQTPSPATPTATVEQPRPFGHVVGDVLTQRLLLEQADRVPTLPPAGRVGLWLERWPARVETDQQGRRWLAIDYQIINAPTALTAVSLPALTLAAGAGPALNLPAWPVSIGPLTLPDASAGDLRPDRPAAARSTYAIERQLWLLGLAWLALLAAWLAWWLWRNAREARRRPFARAWRELRRLDEASPQAWRVLHRALNASAGRVIHAASLPALLAEAPYLRPLRERLEDFYRESTQRFFAADPATPAPAGAYPLRALCRALRDAERRHV